MTVTEIHQPPQSAADALHIAARFVEDLGDPTTGDVLYVALGPTGASIQVISDLPLRERQRWLYDAAAALHVQGGITTVPFGAAAKPGHWGNLSVHAVYRGLPVHVYAPITLVEARGLGLAICTGCAHTDHEGDTCLAAMLLADGDEGHCECGHPDAETILLAGGAITQFDVDVAQAMAIANDRHEERCEQSDDDARDAAAERDVR